MILSRTQDERPPVRQFTPEEHSRQNVHWLRQPNTKLQTCRLRTLACLHLVDILAALAAGSKSVPPGFVTCVSP